MHQSSSIGGGSYCLLNILKSIDSLSFEIFVVLREYGPLVEELKKLSVTIIYFPELSQIPYNASLLRFRNINAYMSLIKSFKKFEKIIDDNNIDIVYLNNMMIAPYMIPSKHKKCVTIMHVREHWPVHEHRIQLSWIRYIVYKYCDQLIAINKFSASIFPNKEATIIYDWIDLRDRYKTILFDDIFKENCSNKKVLLYTGGVNMMNGADYVMKVFSERIVGDEYRLLVLGTPLCLKTGLVHYIKCLFEMFGYHYINKEIVHLQISDYRIKIIPPVYEINNLVEQSFCFVSYFRMPHANLALAENIILKNPCIAAFSEEALEYSGNGEYAMLVKPNDEKEFGNRLLDFVDNINTWRKAAEKGADIIAEKFDKLTNVRKLNRVLSMFI